MKNGKQFGRVVTVIMALIMGVVMAIAAIVVNRQPFSPPLLIRNILCSSLIALVLGLLIPLKPLGDRLASAFSLRERTLPFELVSNLVPSLVINTFNTVIISGINILPNANIPEPARMNVWISAIFSSIGIMFVVSYIASFIAQKFAVKAAMRICPPSGPNGLRPPKA